MQRRRLNKLPRAKGPEQLPITFWFHIPNIDTVSDTTSNTSRNDVSNYSGPTVRHLTKSPDPASCCGEKARDLCSALLRGRDEGSVPEKRAFKSVRLPTCMYVHMISYKYTHMYMCGSGAVCMCIQVTHICAHAYIHIYVAMYTHIYICFSFEEALAA